MLMTGRLMPVQSYDRIEKKLQPILKVTTAILPSPFYDCILSSWQLARIYN